MVQCSKQLSTAIKLPQSTHQFSLQIQMALIFYLKISAFKEEESTPNQHCTCFVSYLKDINPFGKNKMSFLKQIVWETQKWHWNISRICGSWIIVQNISCKILFWSTTQKPLGLLKFECHFWVSHADNLLLVCLYFYQCRWFWDSAQNMLNFVFSARPLNL